MIKKSSRNALRLMRHARVRTKIHGTAMRPRLVVFRSNRHIEAQVIDDESGRTLCAAGSVALKLPNGGDVNAASRVGEEIARLCGEKKITEVVFDRGGYLYHGRIKALAESARKGGLAF